MSKLNSKAFLLFEVAIAVIILSVGITFVMRSFNSAIAATKVLQDYATAMSLAEEKLLDLGLNGLDKKQLEGNFQDEFKKFSWKIDYIPDEILPLDSINLSVMRGIAGPNRSFSVQTYISRK